MELELPALAQSGTYTVSGYVGFFPIEIYDTDEFTFEKEPYDGPLSGGIANWTISGWGDTEQFTTPVHLPQKCEFTLSAFPNPFNPETSLYFDLPEAGEVSIKAYDVLGRKVALLFEGYQPAGTGEIVWNAQELPSGIYFLNISFNGNNKVINCLLLK